LPHTVDNVLTHQILTQNAFLIIQKFNGLEFSVAFFVMSFGKLIGGFLDND
jgi:hypothetical protein